MSAASRLAGPAGDGLAGGGGVVAGGADHGGDAEVAVQVFDDGGLGDEGAAAVAADDELAVFQGAQGLAEGGAGDLELLGQVGFGGQRAAGLVDALLDRVGQRLHAHIRQAQRLRRRGTLGPAARPGTALRVQPLASAFAASRGAESPSNLPDV